MASKKDRQIIFDKFGGKCSYCGDPLKKGWHVDELLPVRRKWKTREAGYYHEPTERVLNISDYLELDLHEQKLCTFRSSKRVLDGMEHPERMHIDNQMPSCPSCNINKHSMSLEDFRNNITGFVKSLNRDNVQFKVAKRYGLIKETPRPIVFYFESFKK